MVPGNGCNQDICRRSGDACGTAFPSEIDSQIPNCSRSVDLLQISFESSQDLLLLGSTGAVPKLQQHKIAEERLAGGHQRRNLGPNLRLAIAP